MSETLDTLMRILRKDEYEQAEESDRVLNESTTNLYNSIKSDRYKKSSPARRMNYEYELTKEVICECVSNLFIDSLVIDDPYRYSDSLRKSMREQCESIMEESHNLLELKKQFENASPYVKAMFPLAESIMDNKTDEDVDEFDHKVFLTNDDKKLINDFEKAEGKDVYAEELQNRIIDVYKKEQELGEERKEKIQNVVDELSKLEAKKNDETNPITESIERGLGMFNNVPETIFHSIFVNKSRMIMNESGTGADLSENAEEILSETICTYTLLECISALGLKTFSDDDKRQLRYEFFVN